MGNNEDNEKQEDYHLEISNILLDEKLLKFPLVKIKYDDFDIKINSIFTQDKSKDFNIKDLKDILSKESTFKCSKCQKVISTFEFFTKKDSKEIVICKDCYSKLNEKETNVQYMSIDNCIINM